METETISKNGRISKSHTSRINILRHACFFVSVVTVFLFSTLGTYAQSGELSAAQKRFQNDIMSYLRAEGFQPSIDKDGDIEFRREGNVHYISIDARDSSPFYLKISRYLAPNNYNRATALLASQEVNLYKGIKVQCYTSQVEVRAEMYLQNVEHFKQVFYKLLNQLQSAVKEFFEEYEEKSS